MPVVSERTRSTSNYVDNLGALICVHVLSASLITYLVSSVDRDNTQWERPLGRNRGGSERRSIQAQRERRGNGGNLYNNQREDWGGSDPREPNQVPQEKEKEVSHTFILEKEQEKEGGEGKNRSRREFTVKKLSVCLENI